MPTLFTFSISWLWCVDGILISEFFLVSSETMPNESKLSIGELDKKSVLIYEKKSQKDQIVILRDKWWFFKRFLTKIVKQLNKF